MRPSVGSVKRATKLLTYSSVKGFCCAVAGNVRMTGMMNIRMVTTARRFIDASQKQVGATLTTVGILPREAHAVAALYERRNV
jgi:hypothetical protein